MFVRACAQCHGGPAQSTPQAPVIRYHEVFAQCPRPVDTVSPPRFAFAPCADRLARNARTYEITPGERKQGAPHHLGPGTRAPDRLRGRAAAAGRLGEARHAAACAGSRRTAPYFHNNSEATLEAVVAHYIEFFKRVQAVAPGGVVPPVATTDGVHFDRAPKPEEVPALLAYLRKL